MITRKQVIKDLQYGLRLGVISKEQGDEILRNYDNNDEEKKRIKKEEYMRRNDKPIVIK